MAASASAVPRNRAEPSAGNRNDTGVAFPSFAFASTFASPFASPLAGGASALAGPPAFAAAPSERLVDGGLREDLRLDGRNEYLLSRLLTPSWEDLRFGRSESCCFCAACRARIALSSAAFFL